MNTNIIDGSTNWNWNSWNNYLWCVNPHGYSDDDNYGTHNGYIALPLDNLLVTRFGLDTSLARTQLGLGCDILGDIPVYVSGGWTYGHHHNINGTDYIVIGFDSVHAINAGDNITDCLFDTMRALGDIAIYHNTDGNTNSYTS